MKIKLEIETVDATYPTDQLEEVLEAIKENFIKDVKDLIKIEAQITKKETIINGINVAECKYFLEPNGCDDCNDGMSMQCDLNPDCYYKQLTREKGEQNINPL